LSEFAGKDRRPVIAQLDRRPAIRLQKIVGPVRQQAHRARRLDDGEIIAAHLCPLDLNLWLPEKCSEILSEGTSA
jgi:hypothetical protein